MDTAVAESGLTLRDEMNIVSFILEEGLDSTALKWSQEFGASIAADGISGITTVANIRARENTQDVVDALDLSLRLMYVYSGGGQRAQIWLLMRLEAVFTPILAMRILQKFLDKINLDGTKDALDRAGVFSITLRMRGEIPLSATPRPRPDFQRGKMMAETITIACPKCQREKVIRPGETKKFRCKKSAGGCGYECEYPFA